MSLFAEYIRECGQMEIIEKDWGFLTYEIVGEECWSGDCYVIPAERKSGKSHELIAEMWDHAMARGCRWFCARISRKSAKGSDALVSHLRAGCELMSMDDDYFFVRKPIKG